MQWWEWSLIAVGVTLVAHAAFVLFLVAAGHRNDAYASARLVPDFIPVAGQLDDAILVALVLRHLVRAQGAGLVRELWPGPERSVELVLGLVKPA